jgi:hypothetical protein
MLAGCSDSEVGVVGVAEAQSNDGPDVSQEVVGYSMGHAVTETPFGGVVQDLVIPMIAKGTPGRAQAMALVTMEVPGFFSTGEGCPEGQFQVNVVDFHFGEIYNDGSILKTEGDPDQFYCYTAQGVGYGEISGTIVSAAGRFEGASGTSAGYFEIKGDVVTGTVTMDFDD